MPLFQTQVYSQQAPGVEGDFCDHNPRTTVDAGPGGLVAASEGVVVARFGWLDYSLIDPNNAPTLVHTRSTGGAPAGFVHREQQGLITNYLGGVSMLVPGGYPITLHNEGGFFTLNRGTTYAQIGMKAFARLADGAVLYGATGSAPGAASMPTSSIAAATFAVTGSITGNVMNVTAVTSGVVVPGSTITGTGIPAGTQVVSQLTGTNGGVGTYSVSFAELAIPAATAIAGTYGILTAGTPTTGTIAVGNVLSGGTVAAGTMVTAMGPLWGLTGTGLGGTYAVNNNTVVTSATLAASSAYETKWFATSAGNPGEIIKMSSWPLG